MGAASLSQTKGHSKPLTRLCSSFHAGSKACPTARTLMAKAALAELVLG